MTDNLTSREILHELKDNRSVEEQLRDHYRDLWRLYQGVFVDVDSGTITFKGGLITNVTSIDDSDSPYTVLASDHVILCDTDADDITVNLPEGVTGTEYSIKNTGDGTVTVDGYGTETIDDELTQSVSTLNCPKITFDGTEWWII